jgi:ribosomal protein S18 acetylase RimI-like enzyme
MYQFDIEILAKHNRTGFLCGVDTLDKYFQEQVTQDVKRRAATCYVAVEAISRQIAGFYTLSAASIPLTDIPEHLKKKMPRYPSVPVARLGRLAVAEQFKGQKLGAALLWDAIERAKSSALAAVALVVDAKDETAKNFYLHYEFTAYGSLPLQLILPFGKREA